MEVIYKPASDNLDYRKPVRAYRNKDYQGDMQNIETGRYSIEDIGINGNTIGSLKIPDGKMVIVYESADFQGPKRVFADHTSDVGEIGENAGSVVVQLVAEIFEQNNFQGKRESLEIGEYNLSEIDFNNGMTSLKVPPGLCVTLYDEANQQGNKVAFIRDENSLLEEFPNTPVTSIKVEVLKVTLPDGIKFEDVEDPSAPQAEPSFAVRIKSGGFFSRRLV